MKFESLGLSEPILRAITAEGYTVPTPIQIKAIPHVLSGEDLLGCAQTGTGKTAAFALPILHRLSATHHASAPAAAHAAAHAPHHGKTASHDGTTAHHGAHHATHSHHGTTAHTRSHLRCLILAPTRELAAQIGDSFHAYGRNVRLRHTVIFGGVNQHHQVRALKASVDILIATPGRLLDLMQQGYVDLKAVEIFVLDEADRMLDMGFIPDIRKIVKVIPQKRQTLMFSATMPSDIRKLADSILHKPVSVAVNPVASTVETITQQVYFVQRSDKPALLTHLLKQNGMERTLVFTRTKHGADKVVKHLDRAGIRAAAIHGNKSQNNRTRALAEFKSKKPPVLVATDIASRGIDVDLITHVINFDVPNIPETYVHRIGRTARAGASGVAISFCDREERGDLRAIERLIQQPIPVSSDQPKFAPSAPAAKHHDEQHGRSDRVERSDRGERGDRNWRQRPKGNRSEHGSSHSGSRRTEGGPKHERGGSHQPSKPAHPKHSHSAKPAHADAGSGHGSHGSHSASGTHRTHGDATPKSRGFLSRGRGRPQRGR